MDVESVLARRMLQLANQILRNRNEDLKELEITAEQADALRFFQGHPGCSAVDLKAHLGITHQAARAIVERMAARGLVQTEVSKTDARYRDVALTPRGVEILDAMQRNRTHLGSQMLNHMDAADREKFAALLLQALENLNGARSAADPQSGAQEGEGPRQ